jgi:flagellar protein FliJ
MAETNDFRLQSVLNFKSSLVENLETEFSQLKIIHTHATDVLGNLERAAQRQSDILLREQQQGLLNCQAIHLHQKYLDYLNDNVAQQKIRVEEARRRLETKRLELVETMKDKKTLENLRDRHQTRVLRDRNRQEAKTVDELVITRYVREGYSHA